MSFIQCKDSAEVEKKMDQIKAGFISADHRIYDEITFSDDACFMELPASTVLALYDLQETIEQCSDGMHEMPFTEVEFRAKALTKAYKNALKAIKFAPLKRSSKCDAP